MKLDRTNLLALLATLALTVPALSVRASTIPITGSAGWAETRPKRRAGPDLSRSVPAASTVVQKDPLPTDPTPGRPAIRFRLRMRLMQV
jgi:hypothetical protein